MTNRESIIETHLLPEALFRGFESFPEAVGEVSEVRHQGGEGCRRLDVEKVHKVPFHHNDNWQKIRGIR